MNKPSPLQLSGLGLVGVGVILHIVCISTPYYALLELEIPDQVDINFGVWKACSVVEGRTTCVQYGSNDNGLQKISAQGWLKIVQALSIVGILIVGGAAGLSIVTLWKTEMVQSHRSLPLIMGVIMWIGALLIVIGHIIFAANRDDVIDDFIVPDVDEFGQFGLAWGFYVDIVPMVCFKLGGLLHRKWGRTLLAEIPATRF